MALGSTARPAEGGYLLALGLVKDRRLLTGSADGVPLSPTDPANSDVGLSPNTVPTSSDQIPLMTNHPPGPAEEGHRFGFVTTTATAGSEVATTTTAGSEVVTTTTAGSEEEKHGLVTPMSLNSSNLNECLLGSAETREDEKPRPRVLTRDRRGI